MAALVWAFPVPDKSPTCWKLYLGIIDQSAAQMRHKCGLVPDSGLNQPIPLPIFYVHIAPNFLTLGT